MTTFILETEHAKMTLARAEREAKKLDANGNHIVQIGIDNLRRELAALEDALTLQREAQTVAYCASRVVSSERDLEFRLRSFGVSL